MEKLRFPSLFGVLGPVIGLGSVLLSIALAPGFDWNDNALSDLGHWFRTDIGGLPILRAAVFNIGLILGGLMICLFVIYLIRKLGDIVIRIVLLSFAATGLFLAGVGVFSENLPVGHIITALGFFFSLPIALGLTAVGFLRPTSTRIGGIILLVLAILSAYELISTLMFGLWLPIAVWEYTMALLGTGGVVLIFILDYAGRLDSLRE